MISLSIQGDAGGGREAVFRSVVDGVDPSHAIGLSLAPDHESRAACFDKGIDIF